MRYLADFGLYALLLLLSLILLSTVTSCQRSENDPEPVCDTFATIRDMSAVDGCGFVFELENGEKLVPVYDWCATDKTVSAAPIDNIQLLDGKRVIINYKVFNDIASICMDGKIVEITCISEVTTDED